MVMITPERQLEESLVTKLGDLKYEHRPEIRDRTTLEANFRQKFEALNRVTLTDGEFQRLLDEILTPDVYIAAQSLRNREAFTRDDGTPLTLRLMARELAKSACEMANLDWTQRDRSVPTSAATSEDLQKPVNMVVWSDVNDRSTLWANCSSHG